MTDRELLELILKNQQEASAKIDKVEKDLADLKNGQDSIANKLDDMEAKNADRHISLDGKIEKLHKDLAAVEVITSKNWNDIATLKVVK